MRQTHTGLFLWNAVIPFQLLLMNRQLSCRALFSDKKSGMRIQKDSRPASYIY